MTLLRTPILLCWLLLPLACGAPDDAPGGAADANTIPGGLTTPGEVTVGATPLGPAPDFTLPTLEGDSLRLADLRGRLVLVNFWATWCGPCVEEIPELVDLYKELEPEGLTIIGISLDEEGPEAVASFAQRFNINYPVALDQDGSVAEAFGGIWALPTTFLIGPEGTILHRVIGLYPVADERPGLRTRLDAPGIRKTSS